VRIRATIRGALGAIVPAVVLLAVQAPGAQAATAPAPGLKVLAISGPTNLPPRQSEVQRLTVEATGGTFQVTRKAGTGAGTPVTQTGVLKVEKGNKAATIGSGSYAIGQRLTATSFPPETRVVSCSPDCVTAGSTVTLSKAPEPAGSGIVNAVAKIFTAKFSGVTGNYHIGDILSGAGIAPGTIVTEVGSGTLTTTQATTSEYTSGSIPLTITQPTAQIPYDAAAAEVQAALDAMPDFTPGTLTVSGGPGGTTETPYFITFGASLADQDVEQMGAVFSSLTGEHPIAHVLTTVPGGAGTGTLVVLPANNGAKSTSGKVTAVLGPLPSGVVTAGPSSGTEWNCPGSAAGQATVTCETTRSIKSLAVSPNPLDVPVEVQSGSPFTASTTVQVSGGGAAAPATFELPIVVSNEPAPFGLAGIWAGSYEADGSDATQAGSHPFSAASDFMVTTIRTPTGEVVPAEDSRDVVVDLQPGFTGNPLASKRCPQAVVIPPEGGSDLCNKEMSVGYLQPYVGSISESINFEEQGIFNDVPPKGYAAAFTTLLILPLQTILASVRSEEDYGIRLTAPNNANFDKIFGAFAAFEGVPSRGTGQALLSNSTDCAEQARKAPVVKINADPWSEPGNFFAAPEIQVPAVVGCQNLKFEPIDPETGKGQVGFSFQPTSTDGSRPVGATAHLHIDQGGLTDPDRLATPQLKRSVIKLPAGLSLNPSQANGLQACTEEQIGYLGKGFEAPNPIRFDESQPACPDASKLGTVEVRTPLLENPLVGTVYLAAQEENPFDSLLAIYLVVDDPTTGVIIKLPGEVTPDPATGRLTATFDNNPQLPFEDLILHFRGGGSQSEFATPEVCGTYRTEGEWTPWSAPESGPPAQTTDGFTVSADCASSAATKPFSPSFEAGTVDPVAGAYSPLVIKVGRKDGEGELRSLDFTLPPGVSGKLAGISYCSDQAIAAAGQRSGKEEQASPSCPSSSELGKVDTSAGVGSEPLHVGGHLYLAGPYKGAPLSAVVITPALAGPFDLGDVVVRSPLYVDPETAVLTARSDPIPTILEGIPLKVRSVTVDLDRSQFALNPTNCELMSATASIGSVDGATAHPSNRFQVGGCEALPFRPDLKLQVIGKTGRNGKPALKAVLTAKPGEANIATAQVNLPHSEFLEQNHIKTVCTRVQFGEGDGNGSACPKGSIYGKVKAWTPLLEKPLEGNVYLRSNGGERKLPDLVAALDGQVDIALWGKVDSGPNHGIRNTFEVVPDAPVSRFVLEMNGGGKGLLVNSENLCGPKAKRQAIVRLTGQNGKVHQFKPKVQAQCKKQKKGKKSGKGHGKK
jgi:hypothetical protein